MQEQAAVLTQVVSIFKLDSRQAAAPKRMGPGGPGQRAMALA
jgi:hypothetical protein